MRLLADEILRAMVFSYGITGNTRTCRRERIEAVDIVEHVAEVQRVCRCEVMVNSKAKLVPVVAESTGRKKSIGANIRFRKQRQQIDRELALRQQIRMRRVRRWHLVEGIRLLEKNVEELVIQIAADSINKLLAFAWVAQLTKIALPLGR